MTRIRFAGATEWLPSYAAFQRLPAIPCSLELFCVQFWDIVYNRVQLSLTHKQLKVGIANQRHPLTSSESSIAHFKKQE